MSNFADDYACADCLARKRWRNGFNCPKCAGNAAGGSPLGPRSQDRGGNRRR
ncbi:transposase [Ensifer adhaerens]|uniref:transposase n=1 Tax=Ensifer adhaerens TaxID=106592 RepID=UPI0011786077